jgi:hypothetical protein
MDPAQNADYAAGMLSGLLKRYGGNVHEALSAYNSGSPTATGTKTRWDDGAELGYADSVMRHYTGLTGSPAPAESTESAESTAIAESSATVSSVGALGAAAQSYPLPALSLPAPSLPVPSLPSTSKAHSYHRQSTDYMSLLGDDTDETDS